MIKLNGTVINPTIFPDGTSQVWKIDEKLLKINPSTIKWDFHFEGEFLHIAQLKHLLDSYGVETNLQMSYLPYARQDKDVSNTSTFALKTFAHLLNSLNFRDVVCLDVHSYVASIEIKRTINCIPTSDVDYVFKKTKADLVCYPDKGATNKYSHFYPYPFVYGEKTRNQITGYIEDYKLIGDVNNKNILIVDDICDGGATFILLAKKLLTSGAKAVNLFVTHGIFSKGVEILEEAGIGRIFTKDGEISEFQGNIMYTPLKIGDENESDVVS